MKSDQLRVIIVFGQATECHLAFVREELHIFDKILVSTIKLLQRRFQTFLDVFLFKKLIRKSCCPQIKTSIRGEGPGITHNM